MAKETNYTVKEITIIAGIKKYKVKPFIAVPEHDLQNRLVTGDELIKEETIEKTVSGDFNVDINTRFHINSNLRLKLKYGSKGLIVDDDARKYFFIKSQSVVAPSQNEFNEAVHFFYISDREGDASQRVTKGKLIKKAYALIDDLASLDEMYNLLYYIGENAVNYSKNVAESRIFDLATNNPERVIKYFSDIKESNKMTFVKKLLSKGLIARSPATQYIMYGEITLGANESEAIGFLYNEKNDSIFIPLNDQLKKLEGK